jgi:hypothetical protein
MLAGSVADCEGGFRLVHNLKAPRRERGQVWPDLEKPSHGERHAGEII